MPCLGIVMANSENPYPYTAVKTMFVWSSKAQCAVDCRIVQTPPAEQDIARANYVRTLRNPVMVIVVIGTGDILSAKTLKELAQAFMRGQFKEVRKGEKQYVIR